MNSNFLRKVIRVFNYINNHSSGSAELMVVGIVILVLTFGFSVLFGGVWILLNLGLPLAVLFVSLVGLSIMGFTIAINWNKVS